MVDQHTDEVIHGALKYLAAAQAPTGSWSKTEHQAAMTGYALMAFLAAGELPGEGEYGKDVSRGADFLLDCAGPNGYIVAGNGNMYGHGIATIALAEIYGLTRDPQAPAQARAGGRAHHICQNDQGGWRYAPRRGDADISVTVLQVVALAPPRTPASTSRRTTIDHAVSYVKSCYDAADRRVHLPAAQPRPGFARTAAGIYCLQVCGLYDDPEVAKRGSDYLFEQRQREQRMVHLRPLLRRPRPVHDRRGRRGSSGTAT